MFPDRWKQEIGHEKWFKREKSKSYPCGGGVSKFAHTRARAYTNVKAVYILQPSEL